MSYENRKKMYDGLVAAGRQNDIPECLALEFSTPPIGEPVPAPKAQDQVLSKKRKK